MRATASIAIVWAAASIASSARAQSSNSAEDKALAVTLFQEARSLVEQGKLAAACDKFAESQRIEPKLGTLLHLATCHEQTGKLASAWAEYQEAAELAGRSREPERQRIAAERARALEPKLARLRIVLGGSASDVELRIDGRKLGAATAGVPFPVDPGTHTIEASAPSRKPWRTEANATESAMIEVKVPELEAAPVGPPPVVVSPPPPPPPDTSSSSIGTATIVVGAVGVAGIAVGSYFGISFFDHRSAGLDECSGRACTARGLDELERARSASLISGIGFTVGVAGLAGAAIVHFGRIGQGSRSPAVALTPGGVRVGGRF